MASSAKREFLRHTVATLSYRGGKTLRALPDDFGAFRIGPTSRSAAEILAHLGDLMDWAVSQAQGVEVWEPVSPGVWEQDVARSFEGLAKLDRLLASGAPLGFPAERLFQGAIADALTHVGQLAMLRRLAGALVRAENYSKADIVAGRVGQNQSRAVEEFDFDASKMTPRPANASKLKT